MKLRTFKWFLSSASPLDEACPYCNGFAGHFEGDDFKECVRCWGTGKAGW